VGVALVEPRQLNLEHQAVAMLHPPLQRQAQRLKFFAQRAAGQLGELGGVVVALGQRAEHGHAGNPEDVGGYAGQLNVGALQ
jgi:hypothetical protein